MNKAKRIPKLYYIDTDLAEEVRYRAFLQNISQSEVVNRAISLLGKLEKKEAGR